MLDNRETDSFPAKGHEISLSAANPVFYSAGKGAVLLAVKWQGYGEDYSAPPGAEVRNKLG